MRGNNQVARLERFLFMKDHFLGHRLYMANASTGRLC
jgi:hypothetical protein